MKINKIALRNFGSYEGDNLIDITAQSVCGNIVLIGGKNGAGKTTLFTAIKICLYGFREGGYQSANAFYRKKIRRLVNNNAKRTSSSDAFIELNFSIINGTDYDNYQLKRSWVLKGTDIEETLIIWKNDILLTDDEKNDFDNYILSIIPPELFELYFFDGEKITEFFLEDGSNLRIKNAFLILCGYDTFDIIMRNFKRINQSNKSDKAIVNRYTFVKEKFTEADQLAQRLYKEVEEKQQELEESKAYLVNVEQQYRIKGGVTLSEWNEKFIRLKAEESFRNSCNEWIKKAANDMIPFIIMQEQLKKLQVQMESEEQLHSDEILRELCKQTLEQALKSLYEDSDFNITSDIYQFLQNKVEKIIHSKEDKGKVILGLSLEEKRQLQRLLNVLLQYKKEDVIANRVELKESLNRSKEIRNEIDNSSVNDVHTFIEETQRILKQIERITSELETLKDYLKEIEIDRALLLEQLRREEKILIEELKRNSLGDLSSKAIIFLEELQKRLFAAEIRKVEAGFMEKIYQMARKDHFIDKIIIDDDFGIHIFKLTATNIQSLIEHIDVLGESAYKKEYGSYHWEFLMKQFNVTDLPSLRIALSHREDEKIDILFEIDKSGLSKGEKQVFIMAIYWSIMRLCNQEVPFIIDTPFARIDSEHRANITEKFFMDLRGQVFIFSTNEEIIGKHYDLMKDSIQARFLLENTDNQKTTIISGKYFGVE